MNITTSTGLPKSFPFLFEITISIVLLLLRLICHQNHPYDYGKSH